MRRLMLQLIRFYRCCLSRLKPPCCRFYPTCSDYAGQAIARYGCWRGGGLALRRICRCHPFYHGPLYDPIPENEEKN